MNTKERLRILLAQAGIALNGKAPTDITVNDEGLYNRIFADGSIAVGESYMDGWWDCEDLAGLFSKIFRSDADKAVAGAGIFWHVLMARIINQQSHWHALKSARDIYDIGNDLYLAMLGPTMSYTCGYWKNAANLDEAQEAKFDLICRKLGFKPGDRVLDIGCGWGNFLAFAAKKYGIYGIGVTVSWEQLEFARKTVLGLDVEIRFNDYRDVNGQFDHIVSVGMLEHVGPKNYRTYFEKVHELLKNDGLFLLHTIGLQKSRYHGEPWLCKYIFPNSVVPSVEQMEKVTRGLFVLEDWHNFGADYSKTLVAWYENFVRAWPDLKTDYGERFFRMWRYYLLSTAGSFRARRTQLWQIVLSKKGVLGGYQSVR